MYIMYYLKLLNKAHDHFSTARNRVMQNRVIDIPNRAAITTYTVNV
jgi:hypothetical protein